MLNDSPISDIENKLRIVFKAVTPDPEYVQKLRKKLSSNSDILLENEPATLLILFTVFSLLSSVLIYWFFKRHTSRSSL